MSSIKYLEKISELNSTPFLTQGREKYICNLLDKYKIKYVKKPEYIYTTPSVKTNKPKIIFVSHLDHPGIVINKYGEGVILGSVLKNVIENIKIDSKILFKLKSGNTASVIETNILNCKNFKVKIQSSFKIPNNSYLELKINKFTSKNKIIRGYSLDNDAATAILLNLLKNYEKVQRQEDFQVYFLFTTVEEVHQLSSFKFCKENPINVNKKDFVINLECKEISFKKGGEIVKNLVVHKGESFIDYGYKFKQNNSTEELVKNANRKLGLKIIYKNTAGSTDARSFSNFSLTPNILTISIPNYAKHNVKNNKITEEFIKKQNLINLEIFIKEIVNTKPTYKNFITVKKFDKKMMSKKIAIDERLLIAYKPWFKYKKIFPDNWKEFMEFNFYKYLSYPVYFYYSIKYKFL